MSGESLKQKVADRVATVLDQEFSIQGLAPPTVIWEPLPGHMLRIYAISPEFDAWLPSEIQTIIWRIIRRRMKPDQYLRLSMILALTPDEYEQFWE